MAGQMPTESDGIYESAWSALYAREYQLEHFDAREVDEVMDLAGAQGVQAVPVALLHSRYFHYIGRLPVLELAHVDVRPLERRVQ